MYQISELLRPPQLSRSSNSFSGNTEVCLEPRTYKECYLKPISEIPSEVCLDVAKPLEDTKEPADLIELEEPEILKILEEPKEPKVLRGPKVSKSSRGSNGSNQTKAAGDSKRSSKKNK